MPESDREAGGGADGDLRLVQVVARVAAGDDSALRTLYDATAARAYGVARAILGDGGMAEEAVAEGYAQVWREASRYEAARAGVRSWVAMIVRARAIDARRRVRAEAGLLGDLDGARGVESAQCGPPMYAQERERERVVRAALDQLPQDQRTAVEAAFLGGLTHAEVALELGAPLGTVKSRIRAGLASLRQRLARFEAESA